MFINIAPGDYVNMNQIVRCEFKLADNRYMGTIYFAKSGGTDRHMVYDQNARDLEEILKSLANKWI